MKNILKNHRGYLPVMSMMLLMFFSLTCRAERDSEQMLGPPAATPGHHDESREDLPIKKKSMVLKPDPLSKPNLPDEPKTTDTQVNPPEDKKPGNSEP